MARSFMGGLELVAMLAILRLDNSAHGVAISREIAEVTGREVALASIYVTPERLASKGLVAEPARRVPSADAKRHFR